MVTAKLYIEGGGDKRSHRAKDVVLRFRRGWKTFFDRAGLGDRVRVVRGGGRKQTLDRFVNAVADQDSGVVLLLLVDSEDAVEPGHSVWQHLAARPADRWSRPSGTGDD